MFYLHVPTRCKIVGCFGRNYLSKHVWSSSLLHPISLPRFPGFTGSVFGYRFWIFLFTAVHALGVVIKPCLSSKRFKILVTTSIYESQGSMWVSIASNKNIHMSCTLEAYGFSYIIPGTLWLNVPTDVIESTRTKDSLSIFHITYRMLQKITVRDLNPISRKTNVKNNLEKRLDSSSQREPMVSGRIYLPAKMGTKLHPSTVMNYGVLWNATRLMLSRNLWTNILTSQAKNEYQCSNTLTFCKGAEKDIIQVRFLYLLAQSADILFDFMEKQSSQ